MPRPTNELGTLLRHWRDLRGKSQLGLSIDAGVSQRHLSFVESGRSVPSREVLVRISQVLDVPLRDRNTLLLAAGYAPLYSEAPWDAAEMRSVTSALGWMLRQHEPFPAVVVDRHWNIVMTNECAPRLFNHFIALEACPKPHNLLHLMFDPAGLRPFIANWKPVAKALFERVYRESVGHVVDGKTRELLTALLACPNVKTEWKTPEALGALLIIPVSFVKDGMVLSYFSVVAAVGIPQTVAAQELRVDFMFPADEATETQHLRLVQDGPASLGQANRSFVKPLSDASP